MRDSLQAELASYRGTTSYLFLACNFWYEFSLGGGPDRFGFDFPNRSLVLLDAGDVAIPTTTWPQCCRAIASLLSLRDLPEDETDKTTPLLSHFANESVYISSFRISQLDMFESVKRVTKTTDADWTVTHRSARERWEKGAAEVKQGNYKVFTEMLYSRMFVPGASGSDGDYQSRRELHNDLLALPVEDLDEATAVGVRMGENGEVNRSH